MPQVPTVSSLSEADYEAIESAVVETARGRWFLAEYARRNRHADTTMLLTALNRIEAVMRGEQAAQSADRFRFDLVEMAKAISRTKAEIAAIKPDSAHSGKFGEASEELDSIVLSTERATSDILAAAEQIQELAWTMREQGVGEAICDLLDAQATDIYMACSFQDLTGQRTKKVIGVLRYLEGRINAMIDIWGLDGQMAAEAAEASEAHKDDGLLNGPARPGHGLDQTDVDLVMGPAQERSAPSPAAQVIEYAAEDAPAEVAELASPLAPLAEPAAVAPSAAPSEEPAPRPAEPPSAPSRILAQLQALSHEERIALFS